MAALDDLKTLPSARVNARARALAEFDLLDSPTEAEFDELVELVARQFRSRHAQLSVVAGDRVFLKASTDFPGTTFAPEDTICAYVAADGHPLVLADASLDERFADHPAVTGEVGLRFYAGAPMLAPDGTVIGALCAWDSEPHDPRPDDIRTLEIAASYVMALLNERRSAKVRERDSAVLAATGQVLEMIVGGEGLPAVLETVARSIESVTPGTAASIQLLDRGHLYNGASPSLPAAYVDAINGVGIGPNVGSCGTAAHRGEAVVVSDIDTDPLWYEFRDIALEYGLRACWSVPIIAGDGAVLGTFALYSQSIREPGADHLQALESWVNLAELAITRVRGYDALQQAATRDPLTGLINRSEAMRHLAELAEQDTDVAVAFFDLDQFKFVNDSFGHQVGDEFLRVAAMRMRDAVRGTDLVARFGGDEFLVICPDVTRAAAADALAHRILATLNRSMVVAGHALSLSASVGIAISAGRTGLSPDGLIGEADLAMYAAKRAGRNTVAVFSDTIRQDAAQRIAVESELNLALLAGELECWYQPSVDLQTGSVVGVEALLRWHSPTRGLVSPAMFIPIAEEGGLIEEIGDFVLRRACAQLVRWRTLGPPLDGLTVWVNVSVRQLASEAFPDSVAHILRTAGLPADRLGLEVTESSFMADVPQTQEALERLRDMGIRIAIDDFGTGYSSLALLRDLPVDMLKIDRQFLAGGDSDGILDVIIGLARTLGLPVVAEGIERPAQFDHLRRLGCTYGQGFLWSRPVPPAEFVDWVRRQEPGPLPLGA